MHCNADYYDEFSLLNQMRDLYERGVERLQELRRIAQSEEEGDD